MPISSLKCPDTGVDIPAWECPETGRKFATGARQSPSYKLLSLAPFVPRSDPPPQVAYVPPYRSMFGNDRYGVCVSSEEAFTKTCVNPERFNSQEALDQLEQITIAWARLHGVLNGADLDEVMDWMLQKGFQVGSQLYNDGPKLGVDFSNETVLRAAIAQGPVKFSMAAGALPGGAGSRDGWYGTTSRNSRTDHCMAFCGAGPAEWLYEQIKVPMPSAVAGLKGYLAYTWSTIGFVTHDWIMGTVDYAAVRNPTTVGVPPLPVPVPPTPPTPPGPGPGPQPAPFVIDIPVTVQPGRYVVIPQVNV